MAMLCRALALAVILLLLFIVWINWPLQARADGVACGSEEQMTAFVTSPQYGETLLAEGTLGAARMRFYANARTGTWSFMIVMPHQTCVSAGQGFKRAPIGKPV